MSSQQTTPSYHIIPSSVARTLARSGVELTPELALEISKAMVEGSGGASTIDNTATAGGTTLAKVAGDNRQAGASEQAVGLDPVRRKEGELKSVERESKIAVPEVRNAAEPPAASPTKLIGGVRHWLAIPRCKACEAYKKKCWKPRVGNRCARCSTKGAVCRSAVKTTPRRASMEATGEDGEPLALEGGAGTSAMNADLPEQPPEPIDVDNTPSPAPVPQLPEPMDVDRSPCPPPAPEPPRRGPHRAARPAPPIESGIPVSRSPQRPPASDYGLLLGITQQLRVITRRFGDEIESRNRLLSSLRRYRADIIDEHEHAARMANMEQVVLGHFASKVSAVPAGSMSERDG